MADLSVKNDGRVLHVVAADLGDADTSYTYFNLGFENYNLFTVHFTITATTISLEATNDDTTGTDTSRTWVDVTTALTGAATATATGSWIVDTPVAYSRMRIKRLTTNATNAIDIFLTRWSGG